MVSARWRWQAELANYYHKANCAKNEFRGLETAAGERLLETPRHFWAVEDGQTNFEGLAKIKLYPRPAVEWLLSKPKREHLVPTSLQRFLQSGGEPTNAQVPTARRPVTEKRAERFAAHYIKSEQAAGRSPPSAALKPLLRRVLTCMAVETISAMPSVDYGASGAGVHLRLLRKSPKNSRRDFAHLGPWPRLRDGLARQARAST